MIMMTAAIAIITTIIVVNLTTAKITAVAFTTQFSPRHLSSSTPLSRDNVFPYNMSPFSPYNRRLSMTKSGYVPPSAEEADPLPIKKRRRDWKDGTGGSVGDSGGTNENKAARNSDTLPRPKVGDIVAYRTGDTSTTASMNIDVGQISFIQKVIQPDNDRWICDVVKFEDVGGGYYAEPPSRKRRSSTTILSLEELVQVPGASFVRTEDAFKIPRGIDKRPSLAAGGYDCQLGPIVAVVDATTVEEDMTAYRDLRSKILKDTATTGAIGTALVFLLRGLDGGIERSILDAAWYSLGVLSSLGYLFLLGLKTDTLGGEGARFGSVASNLRFATPILAMIVVALGNSIGGPSSLPGVGAFLGGYELDIDGGLFNVVSVEQFSAVIIGFLTYRAPLFINQIVFPEVSRAKGEGGGMTVPGSAGVVMDLMKSSNDIDKDGMGISEDDVTTILLVSGPRGVGKTTLIQQFLEESNRKIFGDNIFVTPERVDSVRDPMTFERYESRGEFLQVDPTGRYGLTIGGIRKVDQSSSSSGKGRNAVIIDADINLSRSIVAAAPTDGSIRVVGVWVGVSNLDTYRERVRRQVEDGSIELVDNEDVEDLLVSRSREAIADIDYGVSSGIFEFTILNDDAEDNQTGSGLDQLNYAAGFCFR